MARKDTDPPPDASLYDTAPAEEELWFLPPPPSADSGPAAPPWPTATPRRPGTGTRDWERAEAGLGRELADAAAALARLDQALAGQEGMPARLAAGEVAALSWADGHRLTPERIALHAMLRLPASEADHRALVRAGWARRRLLAGQDPLDAEAFLGRAGGQSGPAEVLGRPQGEEWRALLEHWRREVTGADLHPIGRAAMAFHMWRGLGLGGSETMLEPAILAARIGARGLRFLPFLPLALAGLGGLEARGTARERLRGFLGAARRACQAGLMQAVRLRDWEARARRAIAPLSGRTPPALVEALAAVPVLSAMQAERLTGASRAAVSRNLALLADMGLAREVTGQSRYRFWSAAL